MVMSKNWNKRMWHIFLLWIYLHLNFTDYLKFTKFYNIYFLQYLEWPHGLIMPLPYTRGNWLSKSLSVWFVEGYMWRDTLNPVVLNSSSIMFCFVFNIYNIVFSVSQELCSTPYDATIHRLVTWICLSINNS